MTGIDQHLDLATSTAHRHHHIKPAAETTSSNSSFINSRLSMLSMCEETPDRVLETAPDRALDPTRDRLQGQCHELHLNSDSTSRNQSFPSHQPIGDSKRASLETTLKDRSPIISSSCDNRIRSLPPESKSPSSHPTWKFESPALHSAMMNTNNSRRIYNRWLNKEVLFMTMDDNSSCIKSPSTNSNNINRSTNSSQIIHTEPDTVTISNSLSQSTCRLPPPPLAMSHSRSNTCPAITLTSSPSSRDLISTTRDVNHPRKKSTSEQNRDDSRLNKKSTSDRSSSPKRPSDELHRSANHRLDSIHPRRLFNSDSNLASSCTEERRQNLLRLHASFNKDSSHAKASKTSSKSRQVHQIKRSKEPQLSNQWHRRLQPETEESRQPRAELNKKMAETLWGKQLGAEENQTLCRNSLPRQSLVSEARSKLLRRSIEAELEDVEIEIQDILAQPLTADIVISSPSLFDETPTSSSQSSSSPPVTVQLKVY